MAEEIAPDEDDDKESGPSPQGAAEAEPAGSKKTLIIVIAVVAFLIIVISVVLIILFTSGDEKGGIRGAPEEAEYVELYNKRMQQSLEPIKDPVYTDPFTYSVNMKNNLNYIHLSFRAVLKDPLAKDFLEARKPQIDDTMISLLKEKLPQDIQTRIGLELLKQEVFIIINKQFPQEYIDQSLSKDRMPVKDILFNEFYIQ